MRQAENARATTPARGRPPGPRPWAQCGRGSGTVTTVTESDSAVQAETRTSRQPLSGRVTLTQAPEAFKLSEAGHGGPGG